MKSQMKKNPPADYLKPRNSELFSDCFIQVSHGFKGGANVYLTASSACGVKMIPALLPDQTKSGLAIRTNRTKMPVPKYSVFAYRSVFQFAKEKPQCYYKRQYT